jgi:hypothetical protein
MLTLLRMKRWAHGSVTFFLTFGLGLSTSWIFLNSLQTAGEQRTNRTPAIVVDKPVSSLETGPETEGFVPEFRDLPDLEFDYFALKGRMIDLSTDGIFRRSEVVAHSGEQWLVLAKNRSHYTLKTSTATVRNLGSTSWPGDEKDAKLTFNTVERPILALRNLRGIKQGPVRTLYMDEGNVDPDAVLNHEELGDGYRREFFLDNKQYTLRTSTATAEDGTKVAVLVLDSNESKQVIQRARYFDGDRNKIGTLLWAGDLDGDGKLDLYFGRFDEIGAFSSLLYLSSRAAEGELVKLVAVFGTAGC